MAKSQRTPMRRCVGCGQRLPKRDLIRIVRTPQGTVEVDPTGKCAGRGAYICGAGECWVRGIAKGGLERGLRSSLSALDRERLLDYHRQQLAGMLSLEK